MLLVKLSVSRLRRPFSPLALGWPSFHSGALLFWSFVAGTCGGAPWPVRRVLSLPGARDGGIALEGFSWQLGIGRRQKQGSSSVTNYCTICITLGKVKCVAFMTAYVSDRVSLVAFVPRKASSVVESFVHVSSHYRVLTASRKSKLIGRWKLLNWTCKNR